MSTFETSVPCGWGGAGEKHTSPFALLGMLLCIAGIACAPQLSSDATTRDPVSIDADSPPALLTTQVPSADVLLNGITYVANGPGPHPTVVLLHGLPGQERNLDLAQALRRSGWNVLFFHYRGAWGSPGDFSFDHALEDAKNAVALAGSAGFARTSRADPSRIALVGHSMGGFLAMIAGSELPVVDCIASISGGNFGSLAGRPEVEAAAVAEALQALSEPLHGTSGAALLAEIERNAERYDLIRRAPQLAGKPLLLVVGERDTSTPITDHHVPVVSALRQAGATALTTHTLDADHAYSWSRIELARILATWLDAHCGE